MIPPKEKEGYLKQFTNLFKRHDSFKSHVEDDTIRSILEVLPDPLLALHDDSLMTGQTVVKNLRQVLLCVEIQHSKDLRDYVSVIVCSHCPTPRTIKNGLSGFPIGTGKMGRHFPVREF